MSTKTILVEEEPFNAEHDAWFRRQVQVGLDEFNKPDAVFIPHEVVVAKWKKRRAELLEKAKGLKP